MNNQSDSIDMLWEAFQSEEKLSKRQLDQFKMYYDLLIDANKLFNLTAITELEDVIEYHFKDSLALARVVDLPSYTSLADVGTGAGFPAIPLKIMYPHLTLYAIEVNQKKLCFLEEVSEKLGLHNIVYIDVDWRTFLRSTDYSIDLFCARASLQPEELIRIFSPSSPYRKSSMAYWASQYWTPGSRVGVYIKQDVSYEVGSRPRRLVVFKA